MVRSILDNPSMHALSSKTCSIDSLTGMILIITIHDAFKIIRQCCYMKIYVVIYTLGIGGQMCVRGESSL